MLIQILSAFLATVFFSILFNVNKRQILYCGLVGASGWSLYLFAYTILGTPVGASLAGALAVSIFSNLLAIRKKTPVTIYQISGIIPLVPGAGMYRTAFFYIRNQSDLANHYLVETLSIAGSIALAMLTVYTVIEVSKKLNSYQTSKL